MYCLRGLLRFATRHKREKQGGHEMQGGSSNHKAGSSVFRDGAIDLPSPIKVVAVWQRSILGFRRLDSANLIHQLLVFAPSGPLVLILHSLALPGQ